MIPEAISYLSDPSHWLNLAAFVQMSAAFLLGIGILIALPEPISRRITAQDNVGVILMAIGVVLFVVFTGPQLWTAVVAFVGVWSWTALIGFAGLVVTFVVFYRRGLPARRQQNQP